MPQELVWGQGDYDARVAWAREGDVNVAVEAKTGSLVAQLYYSEDADTADMQKFGMMIRNLIATEDPLGDTSAREMDECLGIDALKALADVRSYVGVWATLDREGCNRLIRMVRRARDAAYGADA